MEHNINKLKLKKKSLIAVLSFAKLGYNNQLCKNAKAQTDQNRKKTSKSHLFSVSFLRSKFNDYPTISSNGNKTNPKIKQKQELLKLTLFKSQSNYCIIPKYNNDKGIEKKMNPFPIVKRLLRWSNQFQAPNDNDINNNKEDAMPCRSNRQNDKAICAKSIQILKTYRDIGIGTSSNINYEETNVISRKIKPIDLALLSKTNKYYTSMINQSHFCFMSNCINSKRPLLNQINRIRNDYFNQLLNSKLASNRTITQPINQKDFA